MTVPTVEALQYLRSALTNGQVSAFVVQNANGTLTIMVDVGPGVTEVSIPPLKGPPGAAGVAQFPLRLQPYVYTSPLDLPTAGVMSNTAADIGRYWIITQVDEDGNTTSVGAYIWFGTEYRFLPFGVQGPPGPYGVIQPFVELLSPHLQSTFDANDPGTGTPEDPYLANMRLSIPQGPPGRCTPLAEFPDVAETTPIIGQFLAATGETIEHEGHALPQWSPANVGDIIPLMYSVPQSAFVHQFGIEFDIFGFGIGTNFTICTYSVPPKVFAWKPIIFGQIRMFEIELGWTPLFIGIEVRLGSPTGPLVAKGFGNTLSGVVNIVPHTSSPSSPSTAMNPWNDVLMIPANHGGTQGTFFVNVINNGAIVTIYDYSPNHAELFVMACPVTTKEEMGIIMPAALSCKVTLSAISVTKGA